MKILAFMILLCAAGVSDAQERAFEYDDHGKRDPLTPVVSISGVVTSFDADITVNDFVLEGIVSDTQGQNAAIINSKVVKVGDSIGAYEVQEITVDRVELNKGEEKFVLKLKKGRY